MEESNIMERPQTMISQSDTKENNYK